MNTKNIVEQMKDKDTLAKMNKRIREIQEGLKQLEANNMLAKSVEYAMSDIRGKADCVRIDSKFGTITLDIDVGDITATYVVATGVFLTAELRAFGEIIIETIRSIDRYVPIINYLEMI